MSALTKLIDGYRIFKATTYEQHRDLIGHVLRQKIKPKTLVITSCSLRISPDAIFGCNPGDLYVIRNVAGLVPPYTEDGANGTIAAIEYAVKTLCVENIVVLGHAHSDGIELLMEEDDNQIREDKQVDEENKENQQLEASGVKRNPMKDWLKIADEARDAVKKQMSKATPEEQERACEQEVILVSMKNLITYPWIENRLEQNQLGVYGWHFDIENGELKAFDPTTKFFELVE